MPRELELELKIGHPKSIPKGLWGGSNSYRLVLPIVAGSSLGTKLLDRGGGDLMAMEGALTKGPKHGHFIMAIFYWSPGGATLFLTISRNCLAESFFILAKQVSYSTKTFENLRKEGVVQKRLTEGIKQAEPGESKVLINQKLLKVEFLLAR